MLAPHKPWSPDCFVNKSLVAQNGVQSKVWRLRRDRQDFSPRIFISDSDFIAMTNNGALCNSRGQLGPAEFERVMREQMLYYTQSRLSAASEFWNTSDQVSAGLPRFCAVSLATTILYEQEIKL